MKGGRLTSRQVLLYAAGGIAGAVIGHLKLHVLEDAHPHIGESGALE